MDDQTLFKAWLKSMDWDTQGGMIKAAEALGKNRRSIERYNAGDAKLSRETRLAMTAISQGLHPWDAKSEGTKAIHISFSMGRSPE